jgi:predicted nucleic acid-binding protein
VLFDTRYFWAVFTSKNPEFLKKLRTIFDSSKTTYASAISIYEVYKLTISEEDRTVAEVRVNSIKKEFTIMDVDPMIAEEAARIATA